MGSREEFIADLYPAARRIAQETGMSWELILAQAAQETGWGQRVLPGTNNLFNIKADASWDGPRRTFNVPEIIDGRRVNIDQDFRVYASFDEALRDRVQFLRENPRYARAGLFEEGTAGNLEAEARALQRAGYATDSRYADAMIEVFNGPTMRRGLELARQREAAQDRTSETAPSASILITDSAHPGNAMFAEIGRRIAAQTDQSVQAEVVANATLKAMESGITSVEKLARVDIDDGRVFIRGANGIDRASAGLAIPQLNLAGLSNSIAERIGDAADIETPVRSRHLQV